MNLTHISEAWRIFKRSLRVKKQGFKQYSGNAKQICKQVIEDCWNGRYFQVSSGHYCCFYMRDFGWCVDSLLRLGYRERVLKTLDYVLSVYSSQRLTTTITPNGRCVDMFDYSPDSLAFLIRSLRTARADKLIKKYKLFLIKEVERFEKIVIDRKTGLVKEGKKFSSMKDQAIRRSSTYNNVMAAMLARELTKIRIKHGMDYNSMKNKIKKELWNGAYFYDDMSKKQYVAGDANVYPFWTEVFTDKKMLKSCIKAIQKEGLDKPFPLKYTKEDIGKRNFARLFTPNYEGSSIWMHMGPLYISLVKNINRKKAKEYIDSYTALIEKHRNFLEIFNPDGTPFSSAFYYADEGMLWAADYLTIIS